MDIYLRAASIEDTMVLYKWASDYEVRKNSFSTEPIDINTHKEWVYKKLSDKEVSFFIIMKGTVAVGQLRVDTRDNIGVISYSIDEDYRGQGIGAESLVLIRSEMKNVVLIGLVKKDNLPSIKAFRSAKYKEYEEEKYIKFIS